MAFLANMMTVMTLMTISCFKDMMTLMTIMTIVSNEHHALLDYHDLYGYHDIFISIITKRFPNELCATRHVAPVIVTFFC